MNKLPTPGKWYVVKLKSFISIQCSIMWYNYLITEGIKMTALTKEQEQYIEQEVRIRVHDEKFQIIERDLDDMKSSIHHLDNKFDSQFKWIIGMFVSSIIIPVILHFVKAV